MTARSIRFRLLICGTVTLGAAGHAHAAVVSLKAVRINDMRIDRTDYVEVEPGDIVEAEIFIRDLVGECNGCFAVYQMTIDLKENATDCGCGAIVPLGWPDTPLDGIGIYPNTCTNQSDNAGDRCSVDADCPNGTCATKLCTEESTNAGASCSLDTDCMDGVCRNPSDFLFAQYAGRTCATDTTSLRYRFGCAFIPITQCTYDFLQEYYAGTVILVASDNAIGTFTFSISIDDGSSFLTDTSGLPGCHPPLTGEPLTIAIPGWCDPSFCCLGCECVAMPPDECVAAGGILELSENCCFDCARRVQSSAPPDCAIDARIPHAVAAPLEQLGWRSVALEFCNGADVAALVRTDFETTVWPNDVLVRTIKDVTHSSASTADVVFNRVIHREHWNCLTHPASASEVCLGALPGDVNANRRVNSGDIQSLMNALSGLLTLDPWQCDIDHRGACAPADILLAIDLLNGAGGYDSWLGATIPDACPSAP